MSMDYRSVSDAIEYLATLWPNEREQMAARNSMCALWVALTNRSVDDYDPPLDRLVVSTDDPLWSPMPLDPQPFRDWIDFTDRVCRPIVEAEDDEAATQAAMALYRKANPHFVAICMVLAANRALRPSGIGEDPK